jgi:hypothetical protein
MERAIVPIKTSMQQTRFSQVKQKFANDGTCSGLGGCKNAF